MLDRDLKAALQRKCKKLGGDKVYAKSIEAEEQAKVCIENWLQSAEISKTFDNFKLTGDFKPVMKKCVFSIKFSHVKSNEDVQKCSIALFAEFARSAISLDFLDVSIHTLTKFLVVISRMKWKFYEK